MGETGSNRPLDGLRVLEVAGSRSVAIAGGVLADLGATVLMLEPGAGSPLRDQEAFHLWARGKQSMATATPTQAVGELGANADVLLIDAEHLAWLDGGTPAGVTVVVDALGRPETDGVFGISAAASAAEAVCGINYIQAGRRPGPFFQVERPAAFGAGLLAAAGALVALRRQGPGGARVRVSQLTGSLAIQLFSSMTSKEPSDQRPLSNDGDVHRMITPLSRFSLARNGWLVICVITPAAWTKLCLALDMVDLLVDPRFEQAPFGIPEACDRNWLAEEIDRRIRTRTVAEWMTLFAEHDIVAAPVHQPGAVLEDPRGMAAHLRYEVEDPRVGRLVLPLPPVSFNGQLSGPPAPAPGVDEHSPEVAESFRHATPPTAGAASPAGSSGRSTPLDDLKVIDLSTFAAGPGMARLLAGLGADVIKLEPPDRDPFHLVGYSYVGVNAGKRVCRVDLSDPADRLEVERLLREADVVVHNFRHDVATKLRLTSSDVAAINPRIIQCGISGFGAGSPLSAQPTFDNVFEALTGGALILGGGEEPVGYTGGMVDNGAGLYGLVAVLGCLHAARQRAGAPGAVVDVTLMGSALSRHADVAVRPISDVEKIALGPDPVGPHAAFRLYEAHDGWVLLAVTDAAAWARLVESVPGLPPSWAPTESGWNAAVTTVLEGAFRSATVGDLTAALTRSRIPVVPAARFPEFARTMLSQGSPMIQEIPDPQWGVLVGPHELITFESLQWRSLGGPATVDRADLAKLGWRQGPRQGTSLNSSSIEGREDGIGQNPGERSFQ